MTTYQDRWMNGRVVEKGTRECASRYEIVREFCKGFQGPFTVCDIGANMCYFGIRLTEDFPECKVTAFEFDHYQLRADHVRASGADRVHLMKLKVSPADCVALAESGQFDLVLALSVLHHVPEQFQEWLTALRVLGRNVILEMAVEDSQRYGRARSKGYYVPGGKMLGYGESHLDGKVLRPIVLLTGDSNEL